MTLQASAARVAETTGITYASRAGDFRKKLTSLCEAKKPSQEIMTITPGMSGVMLERNRANNRNLRALRVARYAKAIKEGRWKLTNQGIAFDWNGELLDGQHRLQACIETNTPIVAWVAFGLDPATFADIDTGAQRTSGQIVQIAGFKDANRLAAAARVAFLYDMTEIMVPYTVLGGAALGISPKNRSDEPDSELILAYIRENPKFDELRENYVTYGGFPALGISLAHTLHWIIGRKHPQLAAAYMEQLCLGENLKRTENVYRLRKRLQDARDHDKPVPKAWKMIWSIDCFNATRAGKEIKTFRMTEGRDFPKVK